MRRASFTVLGLAIVTAIVLVGTFVALGGAERLRASPAAAAAATASCTATTGASTGNAAEVVASTILITSLNAAACTLKVSREDLVLALGRGDGVAVAADALGVTPKALQDAVLGAITKTAADEEAAGAANRHNGAGTAHVDRDCAARSATRGGQGLKRRVREAPLEVRW